MANAWFRMYSEFAIDPKVQMLSESDQRRLTMIFCLRCNGHVTLHDEEVTFLLRISNDEWLQTKTLFIAKGFINESNEVLNWDKRQFASDTSKDRVAAYRQRKKEVGNDDVTLQKRKSNAVDTDTDTDTEQKQIQTRTEKPSKSISQLALLKSRNIPDQLANDWLRIRKEKRQPLTETALIATEREAEIAGMTLLQAITTACENSWAGFKAAYLTNSKSRGAPQQGNKQEAIENRNREIASNWRPPEVIHANG